jgi:hypothetical protein
VRCGELCKSCVGKCRQIVTPEQPAEIQCPTCEGEGCKFCDAGYFVIDQCPAKYIGRELIDDIRVVAASEDHLPVAGGLLDQSSWWFELRERLRSEEYLIQDDKSKRT